MAITTDIKKITESKAFYAVAGVGDYAVEKLRELPEQLQHLQKIQARRQAEIRERARELPVKAREYADDLTHRAEALYDELAVRGRKVISRVTGETALELQEVSETAEPAEATTGSPAKTAPAAKRAARTRATTTRV